MLELLQLNLGKRRAAADLICSLGADIILGQEFPKQFSPTTYSYHGNKEGTAILLKNGLSGTTLVAARDFCIVKVRSSVSTIVVGSLYLHPSDLPRRETALQLLEDAVSSDVGRGMILGTDCNGASDLWGSLPPARDHLQAQGQLGPSWQRGEEFQTCCQQHRGTILNRPDLFPAPTFVGGNGSSHIDVTVAFGRVPPHEWKLSEEFSGSDHRIIRVSLQDTHEYPKRPQLRLTDFKKVREAAAAIPANSSAAAISAGLSGAVAAHTPIMEGRDSPSWWSRKLTKLKQSLNKATKKLNKAKRDGNLVGVEHWTEEFTERRRLFRLEVRAAKKRARDRFYASLQDFSKCIRPPKSKSAAAILNGDPSTNQAAHLLEKLFPRDPRRSQGMAQVRVGVGPADRIPAVTEQEVLDAIGRLKISAPGNDGVNAEVLKKTAPELAAKWATAFTDVLRSGEFPAEWKEGKCIALAKPGRDIFQASGWRPIVLLRCASKLLESVIAERLIHGLGEKFRVPEIHGFCRGRSCDTALKRIVDAYRAGCGRKGHQTLLLTLDESNAFNSVKHSFLVQQLSGLGVAPYLCTTLKSWLTGQHVQLEFGADQATISLERGVPQGSILGPLLYAISTLSLASLLRPIPGLTSTFYADDKTLVLTTKGVREFRERWLQIETRISDWSRASGLSLNPSKCYYLSPAKLQVPALMIDGKAISRAKTVTILGLVIDQRLVFKEHVKRKAAQARSRLGQLHALGWERAGLDTRRILKTYQLALVPFMAHAVSVWVGALEDEKLARALDSVSGLAARISIRAPRSASHAACQALAGICPASIQLRMLAGRCRATTGTSSDLVAALGPEAAEPSWQVDRRESHPLPPWRPSLPASIHPRDEAIKLASAYQGPAIYTDGSKFGDSAGGAFLAVKDGEVVERQAFKLERFATIHQCELEAIRRALRWLSHSAHRGIEWHLFTDSQASIHTIRGREATERSAIARDIAHLSLHVKVQLSWCPGHEGVQWNEVVDQLANTGRKQLFPLDRDAAALMVPPSYVKHRLKTQMEKDTRSWWLEKRATLGTSVQDFLWGYSHARRFLKAGKSSPELSALITGHAPTPHHRHTMGLRPDPSCPCGHADGDVKHLLRDCPLLDGARRDSRLLQVMPKYDYKLVLDRRYRAPLLKMAKMTFEWLKNLRESEFSSQP